MRVLLYLGSLFELNGGNIGMETMAATQVLSIATTIFDFKVAGRNRKPLKKQVPISKPTSQRIIIATAEEQHTTLLQFHRVRLGEKVRDNPTSLISRSRGCPSCRYRGTVPGTTTVSGRMERQGKKPRRPFA
ncbi:unnamed protein product [Nesidiocoris tenuis]|uniref:Uncharacterized protein n=1 Tax=Nesidiocoris tenuis TaxID=355587 RepID=A0A6H5GTH7_9HEMI|nr:unnamed protein product [Nesidiocoris tenuis]